MMVKHKKITIEKKKETVYYTSFKTLSIISIVRCKRVNLLFGGAPFSRQKSLERGLASRIMACYRRS